MDSLVYKTWIISVVHYLASYISYFEISQFAYKSQLCVKWLKACRSVTSALAATHVR